MKPLVSVIMPAYNAEATIEAAIKSVADQTYDNWELIIVNDSSTDTTGLIADKYCIADSRIIQKSLEKNGGLPNARNQGINIAKGQYVAFLDSDDIWQPEKLSKQIAFHLQNPGIKISHTGFQMFNEEGILNRPFKNLISYNYKVKGNLLPYIYIKNTIGVLTVVAERDLINKVGAFDASLWTMEDQDLWIRIAEAGEQFGYLDQNLALYRISPGGISNKTGKYKKAYKVLINKYQTHIKSARINDLILANYYRYFGVLYFKKGNYNLSLLYLIKAVKLEKYFLDAILTIGFIVRCALKKSTN